jgi:hypothetical protein
VCKSTINESVIPNWALRNAVDRYTSLQSRQLGVPLCDVWGCASQ